MRCWRKNWNARGPSRPVWNKYSGAVTCRLPAPRPPPGLTIRPRVPARPGNQFMDPPVTLAAFVNAATRESGMPGQAESRYCCCDSTARSCCGSRHADSADYYSRSHREQWPELRPVPGPLKFAGIPPRPVSAPRGRRSRRDERDPTRLPRTGAPCHAILAPTVPAARRFKRRRAR